MGCRSLAVLLSALLLTVASGCGDVAPSTAAIASEASPQPRISPDDGEPISEWVLFASNAGHAAFLPTLCEIVVKGPAEGRFLVVYSEESTRRTLTKRLEDAGFEGFDRLRWHHVPTDVPYWTRDLFVVGAVRGAGSVLMLHHPDHYRSLQKAAGGSGAETLEILRRLPNLRTVETRARLEGGAVVVSSRHVFLTPTYCRLAVEAGDFPDARAFLGYLEKLYGLPVVVLDVPPGRIYQHADRFLTPTGDGVVMLGDPAQGSRLLRQSPPGTLEEFAARMGVLGSENVGIRAIGAISRDRILASLPGTAAEGLSLAIADRLARQLSALGYRVVRMPWLALRFDPPGREIRFSYTNVVFEKRADRKTAYVPRYGLPILDEAARAIWEREGYRVVAIDTLGPALYGGGVRCLSQVLRH